jgi:SHS2 domain-containing protein
MIYDILDHTADLKIKVYGNSYKSIFENSVIAVSDLIIDSNSTDNKIEKNIEITKESLDDMLIQLLNDLLFYLETENILFNRARLNISGTGAIGTLYGYNLPENPCYRNVIKAITYYSLEIRPENGYAILVLDV